MEHPVSVWNKKYLSFSNFTMKDCMIRSYVVAFVPVFCLHIYLCFIGPGKENIIKYLFLICIWEILKPEKNYSFCLNFPILPEGSITIKIFQISNIINIYKSKRAQRFRYCMSGPRDLCSKMVNFCHILEVIY